MNRLLTLSDIVADIETAWLEFKREFPDANKAEFVEAMMPVPFDGPSPMGQEEVGG